jgi:hypothetical protein
MIAPLIEAFNEDLEAFQDVLREDLHDEVKKEKLDKDKNAFLNDGLITVRTTSGDSASVDTSTQSFLNISIAPTINQLLHNVATNSPTGASSGPLRGVASNFSMNEAQVLFGALQSYQTMKLNVGRQLNLTLRPRSLLGAHAAEMDVQLNADDTATAPNYWNPGAGGGSQGAADLSHISQHDVTTHVRVDSIRLFEVSSFTAILSKGRDKFPILPPFVELPYIGTLAGIPLPAAKEYHNSTAVISAIIVPTATDIAYSLRFVADRVVVGQLDEDGRSPACVFPPSAGQSCIVRKATSFSDFAGQPIREFHRMELNCIATLGQSPYPTPGGGTASTADSTKECASLDFSKAIHDWAP